jgi:hypothetical protein
MVTVDTATGKNMVVWEKKSIAPISSYNIYRESIVAGEYEAIDNVDGNALSEYVDYGVNPGQQAYIYKITAVMDDRSESDIRLCRPHKTIHLLTSMNLEKRVAQLDWDDYYGFDYGTYYIFRSESSERDFSIYHQMPSSTNEFTDVTAPSDATFYYRVAVERSAPCNPTGNGKSGTGPYNHALSNMDDNKIRTSTGTDIIFGELRIYPNPFSHTTTIEFQNPELAEYRVTLRDLSGKAVRMLNTRDNRIIIERGDLAPGLYSIELSGKKIYRDNLMVR